MSAPVSAETIEKAARAMYMQGRTEGSYDRWSIANPATQEECRNDASVVLAAIRADLVAEALAPIRALVDAEITDNVVSNVRLALANARCLDCGIRYGERDEYPCGEPGRGHSDGFTADMLAEAEAEGRAEPVEYVTLAVADLLALLSAPVQAAEEVGGE